VEKARKGLAACAGLFLLLAVACFAFSERALAVLVRLLGKKLVSFSPEEGFIALGSLAIYCAFVLTLPLAGYLLWRGLILPRIPAWRHWGIPVIATASALFLSGAMLGYFVILPAGIGFLVGFETAEVRALISVKKFVHFCGGMLIALGLAFELPLVSFFLARLGWLKSDFFRNRWRHAVIVCTVRGHHADAGRLQHAADAGAAPGSLPNFLPGGSGRGGKTRRFRRTRRTGTFMRSSAVWGQR
jgi:sec-independent protein translocase protein TatC